MTTAQLGPRSALRLSAGPMLIGQLLYIIVTQLHAGGDANDHHAIFATYAHDGIWMAVHVGQFTSIASMLAGLIAFCFALEVHAGRAIWMGRLGGAFAVVTLALYGVLQAVDGVALKHGVNAWVNAPDADKAARFASAEAIRWLEWGVRSYQDFTLGAALLLFAAAVARTRWMPRPLSYLMASSGLAYLVQGWIAGSDGFSSAQSIAIISAWALSMIWMIWLALVAWRTLEFSVEAGFEGHVSDAATI